MDYDCSIYGTCCSNYDLAVYRFVLAADKYFHRLPCRSFLSVNHAIGNDDYDIALSTGPRGGADLYLHSLPHKM